MAQDIWLRIVCLEDFMWGDGRFGFGPCLPNLEDRIFQGVDGLIYVKWLLFDRPIWGLFQDSQVNTICQMSSGAKGFGFGVMDQGTIDLQVRCLGDPPWNSRFSAKDSYLAVRTILLFE